MASVGVAESKAKTGSGAAAMESDEPSKSVAAPSLPEAEGKPAPSSGAGKSASSSSSSAAGSKSTISGDLEAPWVEKYRPLELKDIVGNEAIVERLKVIAAQGNMNNVILAGPPGTGKTTSVLCLARALLGPAMRDAVLELNASDDRGIDVIRGKIKSFAYRRVTLPPGRHKLVILDEADSMTSAAQQALRRTMEIYSHTTRFALACNNSTKIIEPIQSRCAVLRYSRLSNAYILRRLVEVCEMEKVVRDQGDKGLEAILFTAEGDMRHALNNLQSTVAGFGMVSEENVYKVCDQPHPRAVEDVVCAARDCDFDRAFKGMTALYMKGYAAIDIVGTLFRVIRANPASVNLPENVLLDFLREVGYTQMRVLDGCGSRLQIHGLLARMCRIAKGYAMAAAGRT